ncbi:hypothetical protein O181_026296 [Austropuccinia psidii MF-1]|uniref:Reverse transcriptase/retrotransposon-derived protein RNase H-like domain-containing protein n=1 Tax=Austropuccinia psidii MF-1 TaxID=1389203 RepID=A0A9Q3H0D0_9BASI|nr:hypothetical protein [Austropuccinia psidii MF-1]
MFFSKSEEEHVTHVSTVLARPRANTLFVIPSKPQDGPRKSPANSQLATSKKPPGSPIIPCLFQFLLPFHQELFSKKISSLTAFLKRDSHFPLNEEALRKFHQLKEAFTIAPILSHLNPSLPTILETDASDYALGAVLSQVSDSGKHPIAFSNCKLLPEELNYEIHDKELLGIVWALKSWTGFLLSLSSSFEVLTNHSSLQYLIKFNIITCCQALWAEFLSEFHFSITYCPGCLATLPDALSDWGNVYPERVEDFISKDPMNYQKIIKKDEIQA